MAPSDPSTTGNDRSVDLAETPHGDSAHIVVDGEPLCNRNLNAEYEECDELPEGGLCENCKQRGEMIGLVDRVFGDVRQRLDLLGEVNQDV